MRIKSLVRTIEEKGEFKKKITEKELKSELTVSIDEISALVKALNMIVFSDKDIPLNEIKTLKRLGFIETHGRYYVVTPEAFKFARSLFKKLKPTVEREISDFEWEIYQHGIRALAVVYFDEKVGPIFVKLFDRFGILNKLKMNPLDLCMLETEKISINNYTFLLFNISTAGEKRTVTHTILCETVSVDSAKDFLKERGMEIIKLAKEKLEKH